MTNAQIIFNESICLVEEGKIGTTGRLLTAEAYLALFKAIDWRI